MKFEVGIEIEIGEVVSAIGGVGTEIADTAVASVGTAVGIGENAIGGIEVETEIATEEGKGADMRNDRGKVSVSRGHHLPQGRCKKKSGGNPRLNPHRQVHQHV